MAFRSPTNDDGDDDDENTLLPKQNHHRVLSLDKSRMNWTARFRVMLDRVVDDKTVRFNRMDPIHPFRDKAKHHDHPTVHAVNMTDKMTLIMRKTTNATTKKNPSPAWDASWR